MAALSSPLGDLRPAYDIVVVGSGYGGSIAARRMSQKGKNASICVLERGIERQPGHFPATIPAALGQFQIDTRLGRVGSRTALFDMRVNHDVSVLVGCGLGGTSLINAGVMIEPTESVKNDPKWPGALNQLAVLDFAATRKVLGAGPVPIAIDLPKGEQLRQASLRVKDPPVFTRPDIAVSFVSQPNDGGAPPQRLCALCGDCFAGCNHGAKNTADRMFLARADPQRTVIFCGIDVRRIEPDGNGGWRLYARFTDRAWRRFGEPELTIRAGAVFLAAGTLGSTEILLRSKKSKSLALSNKLGEQFSGNGDAIAFGYNCIERVDGIGFGRVVPDDAAVGPTIAGMLDDRFTQGQEDGTIPRGDTSGATIQEGAVPGLLSPLLRVFAPIMARATRVPADQSFQISFRHIGRELHSLVRGSHHGALARTQTYLCMSRDDGDGHLRLVDDRLRVKWTGAGDKLPFKRISKRLAQLTKARGGRYVINPFWSRLFGRRLITVHPLGGCAMGESVDEGVVDDRGRVFDAAATLNPRATHENLYVCDGAIVPTSLGTNPALTISALAERIATEAPAPTERFPLLEAPRRIDPATPGIRYAERLRGRVTLDGKTTRLELVLHISAEDIDKLLQDPLHEARIVGTARTPELTATAQWTISNSTLNVLIADPRKVDTTLLLYQLQLTAKNGTRVWLLGHKTLNLETLRRRGVWQAITSFHFAACDSNRVSPIEVNETQLLAALCTWVERATAGKTPAPHPEIGTCVGRGAVAGSVADSLRLGASIDIVHEPSAWRRLKAKLRYMYFFGDGIFQARAWLFRRAVKADPFKRPDVGLPPDLEIFRLPETPREYQLTRYKLKGTGRQKAVLVAPGFGMAADCFYVGSPSLVEYLCRRRYDVYLLDYRGSDHLTISLTQFTLDELVDDFKSAFARVHQQAGAPIRVIGHCVASLVTTMTLLKHEHAGIVQSAILSQTHVFQNHPLINRVKAWTRLPQLLMVLGFNPVMTSDHDVRSGHGSRLLDVLLRFYPTAEHCSSPVCRRTLLMYGEVLRHHQFDRQTHDMLYDLFDRSNLTLLSHMALLVRRGHAVDKHGHEVYLTENNGKRLTMPITILQGRLNNLFRPVAAQRTLAWMREFGPGNPAGNQRRFRMLPIDHYAHLDHFLGRHAADDVFGKLVQAMDDMDRM